MQSISMAAKEPVDQYLCVKWLDWFKDYIARHDSYVTNPVTAVINKSFEYSFVPTSNEGEMEFNSKFIFTFKFVDKVVEVTFTRVRAPKDIIYSTALDSFTRYMMYGKDFMDIGKILTGNAVLNWQAPVEEQHTLKDIIKEVHGPKRN